MYCRQVPVIDAAVPVRRQLATWIGFAKACLMVLGLTGTFTLAACEPKSKLPGNGRDSICYFRGKGDKGQVAYHPIDSALNTETCAVLLEIQRKKGALDLVAGSYNQIEIVVDYKNAKAAINKGFWVILLRRGPDGELILPNAKRN